MRIFYISKMVQINTINTKYNISKLDEVLYIKKCKNNLVSIDKYLNKFVNAYIYMDKLNRQWPTWKHEIIVLMEMWNHCLDLNNKILQYVTNLYNENCVFSNSSFKPHKNYLFGKFHPFYCNSKFCKEVKNRLFSNICNRIIQITSICITKYYKFRICMEVDLSV